MHVETTVYIHAVIQVKTSEIEKYGLVWNCELHNSVSLTKCLLASVNVFLFAMW